MSSSAQGQKTIHQAAAELFPILVHTAQKSERITYGEANKNIGWGGPNLLGPVLAVIGGWCDHNQVPRIDVLVVDKNSAVPSEKSPHVDAEKLTELVHAFDWAKVSSPTANDLETLGKKKSQ